MIEQAQRPEVTVISTPSNKLKKYLTKMTAKSLNKACKDVTVENVVEMMASAFPELILIVAEENFIAGYKMGVDDGLCMIEEEYGQENEQECSDGSD